MTALHIIFYFYSIMALISAFLVITAENPVRAVLFLVLTFFSMAGVWIILHAEFLALILVLVYVGAVMTLFLFVVMMLSVHLAPLREGFVNYLPLGILIMLTILGLIILGVSPERFGLQTMPMPLPKPLSFNNISNLGMVLYTDYAYPFEIAGVVLLTAIVAAISLTHQKKLKRKDQNIDHQIAAEPRKRLRIVKMSAEKKLKVFQEEKV